jgi:hypothetical protein
MRTNYGAYYEGLGRTDSLSYNLTFCDRTFVCKYNLMLCVTHSKCTTNTHIVVCSFVYW